MISNSLVPITDLFEAHLTVSDLDRSISFYGEQLGLSLARTFPERKAAFFWIGVPGKAMLGLWEAGTMPITVSLHVAIANLLLVAAIDIAGDRGEIIPLVLILWPLSLPSVSFCVPSR
jgi:predicted enzyme related to lactoylglutathione lyase